MGIVYYITSTRVRNGQFSKILELDRQKIMRLFNSYTDLSIRYHPEQAKPRPTFWLKKSFLPVAGKQYILDYLSYAIRIRVQIRLTIFDDKKYGWINKKTVAGLCDTRKQLII